MSEEPHLLPDVLTNPLADPSALGGSAMLGQVTAETTPLPNEFRKLTEGLSALTAQLTDDQTLDNNRKIELIDGYLDENGIQEAITQGDYEAADLSYFLKVGVDVGKNINYTLTPLITMAKRSALDELYQNKDDALMTMIERQMKYVGEREEYHQTALAIEAITQGVDGRMIDWVDKGWTKKELLDQPDLHWFQTELVSNSHFPTACANSEFNRIARESTGKTTQDQLKIREAEEALLEAFGVPEQMSKDFRRSLRARTLPQTSSLQESNKTGGINRSLWIAKVADYCQNIRDLRVGKAEKLHKMCGIVNFDRYNQMMLYNQLQFLDRLSPDGPEVPKDITVVFTDAFGDYNGSADDLYKGYDPHSTLVFEIHKPEDMSRYLALIKQMNIKPSTLVFDTHGKNGRLTYSEGNDRFYVTTYKTKSPNATQIETLGLGRFIREDMQPDSVSGEREILVYVCYGAEGTENADSVAEAIIKQTKPEDKAVVKAAEGPIVVSSEEVAGGEVFLKKRKTNVLKRASTYVRNLRPVKRFVRPPQPESSWEIVQTVEHRRGTRPGQVIKSRPPKGTLVRRNAYAQTRTL